MGKRIISQARGKGGPTYRVRRAAYKHRIGYPRAEGKGEIQKLVYSAGHSAPLMKIKVGKEIFFNPAFDGAIVGDSITFGGDEFKDGNIMVLKDIPAATRVYNIEVNPGDGGKMIRTAGSSAVVSKKLEHNKVSIIMPNKKEVKISGNCRATIGVIAGDGRKVKPFIKAGVKFYKMRTRGKLWPRTSAVKFNAVDHPFGSGRGKRIKPKIVERNAPRGRRVGHIRPRQTGKRK